MELDLFFARFHPLIVHLPIGFLFLGIILELVDAYGKNPGSLRKVILWVLGLSLLAGMGAVATGLLLEGEGSHGGTALDRHKLLGIAVVVVTALALIGKGVRSSYSRRWSMAGALVMLLLLSGTGHMGGEMTHGKTYLSEYAPQLLKPLLGGKNQPPVQLANLHPDSIIVYDDVIQPILSAKCGRCHNPDNAQGGLDMSSYSKLLEESETGVAIVPGKTHDSEVFRRIILEPSHRKFMPPSGEPLSYIETTLLKWWIGHGADSLQRFSSEQMNEELITLVQQTYGQDYHPRPYYERVQVAETPDDILEKLRANGFSVQYLGQDNYLLDLAFEGSTLGVEHYNLLQEIADKVTILDLSETQIPERILGQLGAMTHLTRLDLHGTNVTDTDLPFVIGLEHLESINIYDTSISDEGVGTLQQLKGLQRIYLWQTQTSEEYLASLKTARPDLELIAGFDWN